MRIIFFILLCISLTSCFKQDIPVKPFDRGDTKVAIIPMSPDYSHQFYYKFETNSIVSNNPYDIWYLAFQCYGNDFYILLNGAKFMEAADMGEVSFESVKDRTNAEFKYDSTNGKYDNYSIGKWWDKNETIVLSKNHIYIINRGKDITSKKIGYVKMQIMNADSSEYKIRFANLDGSGEYISTVKRDTLYNYKMFSFDNGG